MGKTMKNIMITAAAATFALGTAVSAGTLTLTGGTAGDIPGTAQAVTPENDVLDALGLGPSMGGWFGSTVSVAAGTTALKIDLIGSEAGNTNTFTFEGNDIFTGGNNASSFDPNTDVGDPLASTTVSTVGGILDFVFSSLNTRNGATGSVANGANPDANPANMMAPFPINFFATFGDQATTTGNVLWLFLDDIGQSGGDNHDDLVIRISTVPLPAGALLLMSGLGALAIRRKRSA
jgi:hypothetical protein